MHDARSAMLLEFVRRNFATSNGAPIDLDTPLLSEQIVDSMGITLLSAFVEEQFGVPFDGTELRKGRLETVRAVAALVDRLA
jgi:acyl carrier protein